MADLARIVAVIALLVLIGCEQRDAPTRLAQQQAEATSEADATAAPADATADTTVVAPNAPTEEGFVAVACGEPIPLTTGQPCGEPGEGTVPGVCDPVTQTGCPEGKQCRFALMLDEDGEGQSFVRVCSDLDCRGRRMQPGAKCAPGQCVPGTTCVSGVCRRLCRRSDGFGCKADEFCTETPLNPLYGYCHSACF